MSLVIGKDGKEPTGLHNIEAAQVELPPEGADERMGRSTTFVEEFLNQAVINLEKQPDDVVLRAMELQNQITVPIRNTKIAKDTVDSISQNVQKLVYYIILQQHKIRELEDKLNDISIHDGFNIIRERDSGKGPAYKTQTYADKVKVGNVGKFERARSRSKGRKNKVVLIYPKGVSTSEETKLKVQNSIDLSKLNNGVCNVKHIKDGGISVELEEPEDVGRMIEQINGDKVIGEQLNAREPIRRDPQIIIFGVDDGVDENQLVNKLVHQNDELSGIEDIVVRTKFKGRTGMNWVLSIKPIAYRMLILNKKVYIGWQRCTIKENLKPLMCYKCGRYGHLSRNCKNEGRCLNCGKTGHERKECKDEANCNNCVVFNSKFKTNFNTRHSCSSKNCKIYEKEIVRLIDNTYYGE